MTRKNQIILGAIICLVLTGIISLGYGFIEVNSPEKFIDHCVRAYFPVLNKENIQKLQGKGPPLLDYAFSPKKYVVSFYSGEQLEPGGTYKFRIDEQGKISPNVFRTITLDQIPMEVCSEFSLMPAQLNDAERYNCWYRYLNSGAGAPNSYPLDGCWIIKDKKKSMYYIFELCHPAQ